MVELILSQPPNIDRLYLEQFLRRDCGVKMCGFRCIKPEKAEAMTPAELAKAIRAAANRGTGAVVLEPIDAPEVQEAVRDALNNGTAIVLLDRPLPSSSPGSPLPVVAVKGFADAGKKIVDAVIEEAGQFHLPSDGKILLTQNTQADSYGKDRLESITAALKGARRSYEVLAFNGDQQAAADFVLNYLKAHPKVTILLSDEELGLSGSFQARRTWLGEGKSELILGGYAAADQRLDLLVKGRTSALADRNVEGYARKALQLALDQMEGKPVPARSEIEMPFKHVRPTFYPSAEEAKRAYQIPEKNKPERRPRPIPPVPAQNL
jgi:ABC-type sugar transport system substrate-binding protein